MNHRALLTILSLISTIQVVIQPSHAQETETEVEFEFSAKSYFTLYAPDRINQSSPTSLEFKAKRLNDMLNGIEFRQHLLSTITEAEKEILIRETKPHTTPIIPKLDNLVTYKSYVEQEENRRPIIQFIAYSNFGNKSCRIVVNKILSKFPAYIEVSRKQSPNKVLSALNEKLNDHLKEEKLFTEELEVFRRKHNIVSFEVEREFLVSSMKDITSSITSAKIDKLDIQTTLLQIFRAKQEGKNIIFIDRVANYRNVNKYRNQIDELKQTLEALEDRYLERHPRILSTKSKIQNLEHRLTSEVEAAIRSEEQKIVTINQKEKEYPTELALIHTKIQKLDLLEIDYTARQKELEIKTEIRSFIQNEILAEETRLLREVYDIVEPGPLLKL